MIEVKNIHKKFGEIEVLKGISLIVNDAEIVSIVGASGAGKTTLLQIMGSLMKPDAGEVFFNKTAINKLNKNELADFRNKNIGFVFQFHHLLPEFSALENVTLPALLAGQKKNSAQKKAKELLEMLNLSHRLDHKPSEISGGEQQRVAIARALINNPMVILADEPTGNLDSANKQELHQLIFSLREKLNQTFIIVTHDLSLADLSDRTIVMKDGDILSDTPHPNFKPINS